MQAVNVLFKKNLFVTNLSISVGLSAFGDYLQQKYENRNKTSGHTIATKELKSSDIKWNIKRTCNMSMSFGLTSGFLCHFWYNFLDRMYPGKGIKIVFKKIISDQIIFSPICIVACLSVACFMKGADQERTYKEIVFKGTKLYIAEWAIWPPAQFINFYFLPTRYRVLYDNCISLVYDVYSSHVQHGPCDGCDDDDTLIE